MRTTWPTPRSVSKDSIVVVPKYAALAQADLTLSLGSFNQPIPEQNAEIKQFEREEDHRRNESEVN